MGLRIFAYSQMVCQFGVAAAVCLREGRVRERLHTKVLVVESVPQESLQAGELPEQSFQSHDTMNAMR